MKILRTKKKMFSSVSDKIIDRLERDRVRDFDLVDDIQKDCISIELVLNNPKIYLPMELEFAQFDVDSYIRKISPYSRTNTKLERNIYVMSVYNRFTEAQFANLVKYIIGEYEYCALIQK